MVEIKSLQNGKIGTTKLDDAAFAGRFHPVVLREAVLMYEANRRVGTASTKTRSQIRGTTHKMYRQKGTGRARHGDRKAPGMRGGGIAHGPHPRDYSYSMPRKALRRALKVALAGKFRDSEVMRWEGKTVNGDKPSTKAVRLSLESLGAARSVLLVAPGEVDNNLLLSIRNLIRVRALPANEVSAYDLVSHKWLVLLDDAFESLCFRLGEGVGAEAAEEGSAS